MILNSLYHAYQYKTMLIVTNRPHEVFALVSGKTHHGATLINGEGLRKQQEHGILYLVVYSDEVSMLSNAIHDIDPDSFVNVIKTEHINCRFYKNPRD